MNIDQALGDVIKSNGILKFVDVGPSSLNQGVLTVDKMDIFVREMKENTVLLDAARIIPMKSFKKDIDRVTMDLDLEPLSRDKNGNVSRTDQDPQFKLNTLNAQTLTAHTRLTGEALEDNIITATLTHNNRGEKIFKDNVPYPELFQSTFITFSADNGEIEKTVLMFNGKAETTLKNMDKEGNITAILDQQKVILSVTPLFTSVFRVFNMRNGREFGSISDAVDDELTSDGDTIVLREGTFTENTIIHKKISIKPENRKVVIKPAKINEPTLTIVNDNVIIQGITITGNKHSNGIFTQANNLQITNCNITGFKYGLMLQESHNATIKNSKVSDCDYGIYAIDSNNLMGARLFYSE